MHVLPLLASLAGGAEPPTPPSATPAPYVDDEPEPPRDENRIYGREHPELMPEATAWDHFFAFVDSVGHGQLDPAAPEARDVVFILRLSRDDGATVLRVARRVRAELLRLSKIESSDLVSASGAPLAEPDATLTLRKRADDTVLAARDELLRTVSARGAKALEHFMASMIRPGMSITREP